MSKQYGMIEEDNATDDSGEAMVCNVTDEDVRFLIAGTPGTKPRRYMLAPFGHDGSRVSIQRGYATAYQGASRHLLEPIIERITKREVFPSPGSRINAAGAPELLAGGKSLPMVVHEDKVPEARAAWLRELKRRDESARAPMTVHLEVNPHATAPIARVRAARPADPVRAPRNEEVDQGGSYDENDPIELDDNLGAPAPVVASGPPNAAPSTPAKPATAPATGKPKEGR